MSSKSARGFADSVTRRLEALEKNIMPVDDSSAASMNELLDELAAGTAPTTPKPKKDKAADPELEKLLEAYAKYKANRSSDLQKIEEIIL
jgi:aromatic ring hydroxylase